MARYEVTRTFTNCTVSRTYGVDADSEEEAKTIAEKGESECTHEEVDVGYADDRSEWDVVKLPNVIRRDSCQK